MARNVEIKARVGIALGVSGTVRKRRTLFLAGNTRIHLDEVEGLGDFMELEVVLAEGESVEEGQAIAYRLMAQLGVEKEKLLTGAYLDMLARRPLAHGNAKHGPDSFP